MNQPVLQTVNQSVNQLLHRPSKRRVHRTVHKRINLMMKGFIMSQSLSKATLFKGGHENCKTVSQRSVLRTQPRKRLSKVHCIRPVSFFNFKNFPSFMGVLFLGLGLTSRPALSKSSLNSMVEQIIEMRQEVELLNTEYKAEKEVLLNDIRSLGSQKAELESQIRREEVRKKQLRASLAQHKAVIEEKNLESMKLKPLVEEHLEKLQQWVQGALPVKVKVRAQALEQLKQELQSKKISYLQGAHRVWSFYQDELRFARETQVSWENIEIANNHSTELPSRAKTISTPTLGRKVQRASVAKVGSVVAFFKTENGDVGRAFYRKGTMTQKGQQVPRNSQWIFVKSKKSAPERALILSFFDSLKKQIRQGPFELPLSLLPKTPEVL